MRHILLFLSLLLLLPACTEVELASHVAKQIPLPNESTSQGTFKVGTPYKIAGKTYHPRESYSHTETGIASWYGPNFHGKRTANGETFDKYELTAAHRTLQMPSLVRVTNLENGRSVVVRVNDRGPFKKNRVIDLSERAAEMLNFKNKGTARVKLEVLSEESKRVANIARQGIDTRGFEVAHQSAKNPIITPKQKPFTPQRIAQAPSKAPSLNPGVAKTAAAKGNNVYVQAGAFGSRNNALAMAQKLSSYGTTNISEASVNGSTLYRVRLGPFPDGPQANMVVSQLSSADIPSSMVVVE